MWRRGIIRRLRSPARLLHFFASFFHIMSDLKALLSLGQAVWLDSISRELITSGELRRLMGRGLRGLTSNPSIFEKAIAQSKDYAAPMAQAARQGLDAKGVFERLAVADIRDA